MLRSKLNQSFRVERKRVPETIFLKVGILLFLVLMIGSHYGYKFIKYLGAFSFIILDIQLRRLYHLLDLSGSRPNS